MVKRADALNITDSDEITSKAEVYLQKNVRVIISGNTFETGTKKPNINRIGVLGL